jgi:hypothetical protein
VKLVSIGLSMLIACNSLIAQVGRFFLLRSSVKIFEFFAVLGIRLGFSADADPIFTSVPIRIQGAKPMRIRILILVKLYHHKKLNLRENNQNILYIGNRS